jgi:hypothetical protein
MFAEKRTSSRKRVAGQNADKIPTFCEVALNNSKNAMIFSLMDSAVVKKTD